MKKILILALLALLGPKLSYAAALGPLANVQTNLQSGAVVPVDSKGNTAQGFGVVINGGNVNVTATATQKVTTSQSAITLTATTSWTFQALSSTGYPSDILVFNQGGQNMLWWIDSSTSSPLFDGISSTAQLGAVGNIFRVDTIKGNVFHWRYSASGGNGFLVERY